MPKKKKSRTKRSGPKYQRYFFAYSDKMIMDKLMTPTSIIQTMVSVPFFGQIPLKEGIIAIEFPQTTGDVAGRYGIIAVPDYHVPDFLSEGPNHSVRKISPRELDPVNRDLVYLLEFDLNHNTSGELGKDIAHAWENINIIPYRVPVSAKPIKDLLVQSGYECPLSFAYSKYRGIPLQVFGFPPTGERKYEVFGITQDPKIHFHRINSSSDENSFCDVVSRYVKALPQLPKDSGAN